MSSPALVEERCLHCGRALACCACPEPCDECGHVRCVCDAREAEALTAEPADWREYRQATARTFAPWSSER